MKKYILLLFIMIISCVTVLGDETAAPKVDAQGAILIDAKTGRVLWGKNENEELAMASTTKIMTAIVTLENADLSELVTVSRRAAGAPEVKMFLTTGEKIRLEYLLYALMLQSSNDAAVAIAEHISGTVEDFCKLMTEKAHEIGAVNTIFETPNGLDLGNHHSTAHDMSLITKYSLENSEFIKLINTPSITATSDKRTYSITNKNRLLREFEGANGVKTGFTGKAGHCFVGAAKRNDMQLISVVLASGWGNKGKEQKWVDTKQLLNYGFNNYKYENIVDEGAVSQPVDIDRSKTKSVETYFSEGLMLPLRKDEIQNIEIKIELPKSKLAPVEEHEKIGTAKIFLGEQLLKEIDLNTAESASRHDLKTSIEKILNSWLEMITYDEVKVILPEF